MASRQQFINEYIQNSLKAHHIQPPTASEIKHRFDNLIAYTYPNKNIYDDVKTKQSLFEISQKPLNQIVPFETLGK